MELIKYDAMITAIAECNRVDELKDLRDKALALEAYMRQAHNTVAENQAIQVRLRAERQCGILLKAREMNKGAEGVAGNEHSLVQSNDTTAPETLKELGITKDQSSRFQKLADIPDEEFNEMLGDDVKPTTIGVIKKFEKRKEEGLTPERKLKRKQSAKSISLWGAVAGLVRSKNEMENDVNAFLQMKPFMIDELIENIDALIPWLTQIKMEAVNEECREQTDKAAN